MKWKIPLFEADIGEEEISSVLEVLKSGWLTMGEKTAKFEEIFGDFIGVKYAIAVNSGTAALHLALLALGIGPGDDVICPSLTFVATSNSIKYAWANVIFADVTNLDDWNIGVDSISAVKTAKTRAVIVVHYGGYPCDMEAICEYAKRNGLAVIEDCAHAPGGAIGGRRVGAWGDVGCFSFFSNKNLSTGEGGMLTTNNEGLKNKLRSMRSHGMTTLTLDRFKGHSFDYDVTNLGYNYRMTEISAALGLAQFAKLTEKNSSRRKLVKKYQELLINEEKIGIPFIDYRGESTSHIFPILIPEGIDRGVIMNRLKEAGIQTSIHYRPIHIFSYYADMIHGDLSKTEVIGRRTITLPLFPSMSGEQVKYVAESVLRVAGG